MAIQNPLADIAQDVTLGEIAVRLSEVADLLSSLQIDHLTGRLRTDTTGSLTAVGTVTTVTTVATMANQTNIGGYPAALQTFQTGQMAEMALRQNIVIS